MPSVSVSSGGERQRREFDATSSRDEDARDGRVARGERNHARIVAAVYDVVRSGRAEPSVDEVAARAGVSVRTIFRQFQDLESLARSVSERVLGEAATLFPPAPLTGTLDEDLRGLVTRRARVYEHMLPFRHAGHVVRHRVAFLTDQETRLRRVQRERLEAVVGPHLVDPSGLVLEGLEALLSIDAWQHLRVQQGLSAQRAEETLLRASVALLARP